MAQNTTPAEDPHVPALAELGGFHFAIVADDTPEKRLNLHPVGPAFDGGPPDREVGKRALLEGISGLRSALEHYSQVLEGFEGDFDAVFDEFDTGSPLLEASDAVHRALFGLKIGHEAYTGFAFMGDPLMRDPSGTGVMQDPAGVEDGAWDEGEEDPEEEHDETRYGPSGPELGVTIALNKLLHSGDGLLVQLATAKVYASGVMFGIECAQIRSVNETDSDWQRRVNAWQGSLDMALGIEDPAGAVRYTDTFGSGGASFASGTTLYSNDLWVPGLQEATEVHCTLRIHRLMNDRQKMPRLRLKFDLDPAVLREAATRAHRPDSTDRIQARKKTSTRPSTPATTNPEEHMELFDGTINVAYGQFYLLPEGDYEIDMDAAFRGQDNGLCGAAAPPGLFFITGLHTGHVGLSVHLHDSEPALAEEWEEVVEVPYEVTEKICLAEWGGPSQDPLPIPRGSYRLRYAGIKMDEGHEQDCILEGEDTIDSYRIDLWPAFDSTGDRILRQHGEQAAYWHGALD
ncbi:hypothetical protein ACSYDW_08930 [Paeniglutamicibacter sp. R2-26]|uniref:hypothetical protein n=1 Tax=Paeniglutamicibacter sp. R2-26 TaxID=3144417 RepID=UPI003EE6892E